MEMDGAPKKVGQLIKVPAGLPLIRVTNTLLPPPSPLRHSALVPAVSQQIFGNLATKQCKSNPNPSCHSASRNEFSNEFAATAEWERCMTEWERGRERELLDVIINLPTSLRGKVLWSHRESLHVWVEVKRNIRAKCSCWELHNDHKLSSV